MSITRNILLVILSFFSMNIVLQFALGIRGISESRVYDKNSTMKKLLIVLVTVVLLWILFSKIIVNFISSLYIYVILFPVSYMVYSVFEYIFFNFLFKKNAKEDCFLSFPGGITALILFLILNLAINLSEALLLSFGFVFGILFIFLIIREIRRASALENVPVSLRGKPLVLISLGLLSLVFSMATIMLLRMINI